MCFGRSAILGALVVIGVQVVDWSCQRATPVAPITAPATAPTPATVAGGATGAQSAEGAVNPGPSSRVVVQLTEQGFVPDRIAAEVGKPLTLVITRKTNKTCAREITFKGQPGKTELPLDKEVEVSFTPKSSGSVPFGCAMGMMVGGTLEVR